MVPVQIGTPDEVEVWAAWTEDDAEVWEAFIATPVEDENSFRLGSVPAYAYGLNYGDIVECMASAEGPLVIRRIASSGGQATFRIWLGTDVDPAAWRSIAGAYAERGCIVDVLTTSLVALSCANTDAEAIRLRLEEDA